MRLLLVSARHHSDHGGIGTYVTQLTEQATAAGWAIELLTRPGRDLPPAARVYTVDTPDMTDGFARRVPALRRIEKIRPYRYGLWSLAVARWLLEHDGDADVIEFVDCQAEGLVALSSNAVRRRWAHVPMVACGHTPMFIGESFDAVDRARFGRSIYFAWERAALAHADGVLVPTRALGRRLPGAVMGLIPFPLTRGPAGSTEGFSRRIIAVGALQPRKGFDVWARSLHEVLASRPDVEAVLVGADTPTGPGGTSAWKAIRSAVPAAIRSRLRWLGPRTHREVIDLIASSSMVVVPSRFESFSYVAAEAIARGRPVVLGAGVGLLELAPSIVGVAVDDVGALAGAQAAILDDPSGAAAAAETARSELMASCSPVEHFQRRARFVRSLAGRRPRPEDRDGVDAIDRMERFLDQVEQCEADSGSALDGATTRATPTYR